jgi:biotin carboxyl carrier protein
MTRISERYIVTINEKEYDLILVKEGDGYKIEAAGREYRVGTDIIGGGKYLFRIDNASSEIDISSDNGSLSVFLEGQELTVRVEPYSLAELRKRAGTALEGPAEKIIRAPMPGLVIRNEVRPGDKVAKGQSLVIIEAMKMENVIKSPYGGKVGRIFISPGQAVDKNDKLVELE